jgi:hypothetical protein
MQSWSWTSVGWLMLALLGCARDPYAELGLVEVTGIVTLDGRPLAGAKVCFEADDKRQAIGRTNATGAYQLMYDSRTPGVMPGKNTVRITTADADVEGDGLAEGAVAAKETVPERYNTQSELTANVSGAKATLDFHLKSAPR